MDLFKYLEKIQNIFDLLPSKYMLLNGNFEKNLKFYCGMMIESDQGPTSYVMDKKIQGHEIDLLAFLDSECLNASEFKCTFASDRRSTLTSANDAIKKIQKTVEVSSLSMANKQIIHFLNKSDPCSSTNLNPDWIKSKYPTNQQLSTETLIEQYKKHLGTQLQNSRFITYNFADNALALDVIIVDIAR
jgi:hypothetical protein